MALPSLAGWQTESIRLTFFAAEPVIAQNNNWWKVATGKDPEHISSRPNSSEYSEAGQLSEKHFLEMKCTFNRIDWILLPIMTPGSTPPSIGETENSFQMLLPQILQWLDSAKHNWIRIAYGHAGMLKTASIADANSAIQRYIQEFNIPAEKAKDLILQINYPKESQSLPDLTINRIAKVMSASAQFFTIGASPIPIVTEETFFKMELDLNTSAERNVAIPDAAIRGILEEIISSTRSIFEDGIKP